MFGFCEDPGKNLNLEIKILYKIRIHLFVESNNHVYRNSRCRDPDILDNVFLCLITCSRIWGSQRGKPQTSVYSAWWKRGPSLSIYKIATIAILPIMYTRGWTYTLFVHKSKLVFKAHYYGPQLLGLSIIKLITTTSTRFFY
jgi:hypothetical protein